MKCTSLYSSTQNCAWFYQEGQVFSYLFYNKKEHWCVLWENAFLFVMKIVLGVSLRSSYSTFSPLSNLSLHGLFIIKILFCLPLSNLTLPCPLSKVSCNSFSDLFSLNFLLPYKTYPTMKRKQHCMEMVFLTNLDLRRHLLQNSKWSTVLNLKLGQMIKVLPARCTHKQNLSYTFFFSFSSYVKRSFTPFFLVITTTIIRAQNM